MELRNAVIIVTGGGSGIGAAMASRFESEGAKVVVRADIVASNDVDAVLDVTDAAAVVALVERVQAEHGPIDLYCSNAGIATGQGVEATDEAWQRIWDVNVMGTVNAARAVLPGVRERGMGYLLVTASAAGLLTNLGDAPYTATKHAAVGLAEWLAITHGDEGLKVSCLCPQGVRTPMVTGGLDEGHTAAEVVELMGLIEPEQCAEAVVDGLRAEQFLILPHPEVRDFMQHKVTDPDRWLVGMRKLLRRLAGG